MVAILAVVIAVIQFPSVVKSPSRVSVLCVAAAIIIFVIGGEIFAYFEEKKKKRLQFEELKKFLVTQLRETTVAPMASPPQTTELGMSADDPRICPNLEKPAPDLMQRTPLILINDGKDVAHSIQIQSFKLDRKNVSFPLIEMVRPGDKEEVLPTIDRADGVMNEHDIFHWLVKDWDKNGEMIDEWPVPIKISYTDFTKKKQFVTTATLVFHAIKYILERPPTPWPSYDKVIVEFRDVNINRIT